MNPFVFGNMSDFYRKPGADTLHEVTESYKGAKLSQIFNLSVVGVAVPAEGDNPFSIYSMSHNSATPQTATNGVGYNYYDKNGNLSNELYKSGRAEYIVKDPSNKKEPQRTIQTYP